MKNQPPDAPASPHATSDADEVRRALRDATPWVFSIAVHLLLVLVAVLVVWTTVVPDEEPGDYSAEMTLVESPTFEPVDVTSRDDVSDPSSSPTTSLTAPPATVTPELVGMDAGSVEFMLPPGELPGDQGQNQGPWGENDGKPSRPLDPGNGKRVVFVIDASGSLIDTFPLVLAELRESLVMMGRNYDRQIEDRGQSDYAFAVLFFRNGEVIEMVDRSGGLGPGMKAPDQRNIAASLRWLAPSRSNIAPGGSTSPMPAIEMALRFRPDTVVLLSDNITGTGVYGLDPEAFLDAVIDARGDRNVVFHTVQFLYPDPAESYGQAGTLSRLSEMTGGHYMFADEEMMMRR